MSQKTNVHAWMIRSLIAASGITFLSLLFWPESQPEPYAKGTQETPAHAMAPAVFSDKEPDQTADNSPSLFSSSPSSPAETPSSMQQEDLSQANQEQDDIALESNAQSLERFNDINTLLDNIDDPDVQDFISTLPEDAQRSIHMQALQQSVSKRLDAIEAQALSPIDLTKLFDDIDLLAQNLVLMPEEAKNLKSYLKARAEI